MKVGDMVKYEVIGCNSIGVIVADLPGDHILAPAVSVLWSSGELVKRLRNGIGRVISTTGIVETVGRIGANEIDTRIEATITSTEVAASPNVRSPCAPMMPRVCAII
jgi:hypothetical protein